jgi:hypothetical protein
MLVPTRSASDNPRLFRAYTDDDMEHSDLTEKVSAVFQRSKVLESDRAKMKRHVRMTTADVQRSGLAQITIKNLEIFASTPSATTRSGHHEGDGARDESHRPHSPDSEPSESVSIDSVLAALDTIISDEIHNGVGILYNMHATVYLAHALVALVDRVREVHDAAKPAVDEGHDAKPVVDEKAQSCVRLSHCLRLFSRLLEFESKVDKKLRRQHSVNDHVTCDAAIIALARVSSSLRIANEPSMLPLLEQVLGFLLAAVEGAYGTEVQNSTSSALNTNDGSMPHAAECLFLLHAKELYQNPISRVAMLATSVRALETAAGTGVLEGRSQLFIHRPYDWHVVDVLMTNFHMPHTTLLMMIDAFVGDRWKRLYETAVAERYRLFSFGDAMLLNRHLT